MLNMSPKFSHLSMVQMDGGLASLHPFQQCFRQDDGWVMMKDCEQWKHVYSRRDFHLKQDLNPGLPIGIVSVCK